MLVDVETTVGVFLANIIHESERTYKLKYLVAKNKVLYDYDEKEEEIEKACICGFYDPEDTEETAGFYKTEKGFIRKDEDDKDYEPSECEEEDSSSDVSLVDSDDDEDDLESE